MEVNSEHDPLSPNDKPCSFCGTDYDDEDWGILGWIGILPISLCIDCQAGIFNMVYQLTPIEDLEELVKDYKSEPA